MRASAFLAAAFATLTLAAPNPSPDIFSFMFGTAAKATNNKIAMAINDVTDSVQQLNVAIRAVKAGSLADLAAVAKQGQVVGQVLKAAETQITAAPKTDAASAILVQNSARMLAVSINNVATSLIQKKAIVQKAGLTASVVQMLENQATANNVLTKAVQEKLPTTLQQNQVGQDGIVVAQSLNRVVLAYSGGVAATGTGAQRLPKPTGAAAKPLPPKRPVPLAAAPKNGTAIAAAPKNGTAPAATTDGSRTVQPAAQPPKAATPAAQEPKAAAQAPVAAAQEPKAAAPAIAAAAKPLPPAPQPEAAAPAAPAAVKPAAAPAVNAADAKSGTANAAAPAAKTTGSANAASVSTN